MSKDLASVFLKDKDIKEFLVDREQEYEYISTNVVTMNLLLSGRPFGGIQKGSISMISAGSSQGKTFLVLVY